jgi:hypothetical protein
LEDHPSAIAWHPMAKFKAPEKIEGPEVPFEIPKLGRMM